MKKEKECFEKDLEKCFGKEWKKHFEKTWKSIKKRPEKVFWKDLKKFR